MSRDINTHQPDLGAKNDKCVSTTTLASEAQQGITYTCDSTEACVRAKREKEKSTGRNQSDCLPLFVDVLQVTSWLMNVDVSMGRSISQSVGDECRSISLLVAGWTSVDRYSGL